MKTYKNYTPHAIVVNDGSVYEPSGIVARVAMSHTEFADGICDAVYGEITGLPEPEQNVLYIVSAMVLSAAKLAGRTDCIAPATGHPETIRNEKGHILSVPGFVR